MRSKTETSNKQTNRLAVLLIVVAGLLIAQFPITHWLPVDLEFECIREHCERHHGPEIDRLYRELTNKNNDK